MGNTVPRRFHKSHRYISFFTLLSKMPRRSSGRAAPAPARPAPARYAAAPAPAPVRAAPSVPAPAPAAPAPMMQMPPQQRELLSVPQLAMLSLDYLAVVPHLLLLPPLLLLLLLRNLTTQRRKHSLKRWADLVPMK